MPMKKSAAAKLQTKNLGTSIFDLEKIKTNTTVPLPSIASRNTTHTPHLNVHQSNKSWHGKNGPGIGKHCTEPGVSSELNGRVGVVSSSKYSSTYAGRFPFKMFNKDLKVKCKIFQVRILLDMWSLVQTNPTGHWFDYQIFCSDCLCKENGKWHKVCSKKIFFLFSFT